MKGDKNAHRREPDEKGNFVFHGRTDSQVKVNGYRIELVEVENSVNSLVNTKVIVQCVKSAKGFNQLIAFVEAKEINENQLKEDLLALLPTYMIPFEFIAVNAFMLNENGKVDKQALLNFM